MAAPKGLTIRANDQIVTNVYHNIVNEFVNYRGLQVTSDPPENFAQEIFSKGHIIIETSDGDKKVYIVLYHFIVSESLKAVDVKKLVAKLSKSADEIILVTQNQVITHIANYIREAEVPIYAYTYCNFILVVPKHILVPKYKVLSKDEQDYIINKLNTKKSMLPKIKKTDPCVVWSTAKTGDIIEFTRADDVTGLSMYYRVVV